MISLGKYLNLRSPGKRPSSPSDLAVAMQQALRLLLEGIPRQLEADDPAAEPEKKEIARLVHELDGRVQPLEAIEIANSALAVLEQNTRRARERHHRHEEQSQELANTTDLSHSLVQALQTLLVGWPIFDVNQEGTARQTLDAIMRRLDGALDPDSVFEIAESALAAIEVDAHSARERIRQAEDQHYASASASLRALQIVLEGAPLGPEESGKSGPHTKRAITEIRSRSGGAMKPAEVISIAEGAVNALQEDARSAEVRRRELERQQAETLRDECSDALRRGLDSVLAALPFSEQTASLSLEEGMSGVAGLHGRLSEASTPAEIDRIVEEAIDALSQNLPSAGNDTVSDSLVAALRTLLETWPVAATGVHDPEGGSQKAIRDLLSRLDGPLAPHDLEEILNSAFNLLKQDVAKALEAQHSDSPGSKRTQDTAEALLQALRLVLGGLPLGKGNAGQDDTHEKTAIQDLLNRLEHACEPFDILEIADEVLAILERNHKRISEQYRLESEERQAMIGMLTEAVAGLSMRGTAAVARLQQIEQRVDQASQVGDLRSLKTKLGECLVDIRDAARSQQQESQQAVESFQRQIQVVRNRVPRRPANVEEIPHLEGKRESKTAEYMVVFLLDREASIASRFGEEVRQSILKFIGKRLKDALTPSDRVVRWKGAAFLASLKRTSALQEVRAEIASITSVQVPPHVEVGERTIRLPISLSWAVFAKSQFASLDKLFEKVDEFVAKTQSRSVA